jgi:hypothetical protein
MLLKATIEQSYAAHPAFQFGRSWALCGAAGRSFAAAFEARDQQACRASMRAVFNELRAQAADDGERRFIDELHGECLRLLEAEFAHFARQRPARPAGALPAPARDVAEALAREHHHFGRLSAGAVCEMQALSAPTLAQLRQHAAAGQLTREALSINRGPVVHALATLLNREFERLGVLDAVSLHARRPMRVTGLAYELSVPQAQWWRNGLPGLARAPRTLYAHLDESSAVPKAIVYLSDVAAGNGPTSCYPGAYEALELHPLQDLIGRGVGNVGRSAHSPLHSVYAKGYHQSMTSEAFRRHFMKLPAVLRFNSHLGWDLMPDSGAEAELVRRERTMIGPAGSFIVFDGARLLHRGGLLESGERIALQVMFSEQGLLRRTAKQLRHALAWA